MPRRTSGRWKNPDAYTVSELANLLDPPLTKDQIWALIKVVGIEPVATVHDGTRSGGRPARTYRLDEILAAHKAIAPLLDQAS